MWKHIQRVVVAGGLLGGLTFWLSTNSIPDTIVKADGFLRTNLIWLGWLNPPSALASSAADHTGAVVGLVLMIMAFCVLLLAGIERVFGATAAQKLIAAPGEAVRYVERHIHHKELSAEVKPVASLDMAVHRAPQREKAQGAGDMARTMLREQRLEQLELDHRLKKHDSRSDERRAHIADCRKMIAEYDGGHSLSNQRKAMYKSEGFLALKSHLPDHFIASLNKNILGIIDPRKPDIPVMMNALNSHLSQLEKEWGLE